MPPFEQIMTDGSPSKDGSDEAFLSLLSSQRRLLERIRMEQDHGDPQHLRRIRVIERENQNRLLSVINRPDPLSLMNAPTQGYMNQGIDLSQRLLIRNPYEARNFYGAPIWQQQQQTRERNIGFDDKFLDCQIRKKEVEENRLINTVLASAFLPEDQKVPSGRRLSLLSSLSGALGGDDESLCGDKADDVEPISLDEEEGDDDEQRRGVVGPMTASSIVPPPSTNVRLDSSIPTDVVHNNLANFVRSMDDSTQTQQDLHDWDRQMGLKRSHCKTMRSTMRSRKKLRQILKKDITSLQKHTPTATK